MDERELLESSGHHKCTDTYSKQMMRSLESTVDGIFLAPKFGSRFGVSRGRFEELLKYLPPPPKKRNFQMQMTSRYLLFADLLRPSTSDKTSRKILSVMEHLCVDESISAWRGKDGN